MDDVPGGQVPGAGDRGFADFDRSMLITFRLDGGPAAAADRPRHPSPVLQLVVGGVDDGVDRLFRQVPLQDDNMRVSNRPLPAQDVTSATRFARVAGVASNKARTPIDSMAMDAQATP